MSAGVSSFIAGCIAKDVDEWIYIDIDDQHQDSMRFIRDCERAIGKQVTVLKSPYGSVENVIRAAGVIKLAGGFAPCTAWLKKRVRSEWEADHAGMDLTYVWGMDRTEDRRAARMVAAFPQFKHEFPLIEQNISKEAAHYMLSEMGIRRPAMYDMGYRNNNCIGCIKGGMGYWNRIRKDFPEVFEARARLEREIGHSILKECYLDELDPERGKREESIMPECDIFCMMNRFEEHDPN